MKLFTCIVKLEFCNVIEAENENDFINKIKEFYKEDHNLQLVDNEIIDIEEVEE